MAGAVDDSPFSWRNLLKDTPVGAATAFFQTELDAECDCETQCRTPTSAGGQAYYMWGR